MFVYQGKFTNTAQYANVLYMIPGVFNISLAERGGRKLFYHLRFPGRCW